MGYRFSLVLNREISHDESVALKEAACSSAVFVTDSHPTNASVTVTKMDFDDTVSPSLAEAIETAIDAVKKVPNLSVPCLTVPAQPATPAEGAPAKGLEAAAEDHSAEAEAEEPAAKKATVKKSAARKASVVKSVVVAEPVRA